jgi:chemotaxis protein MotB
MRRARAVMIGIWGALASCAGTPKVEQSVLVAEQAKYEERIRRLEEERVRDKKLAAEEKAEAEAQSRRESERVEQLEIQLADKQRTLDDVTAQLVELQDAFGKLTTKERQKIQEKTEKDKAQNAAATELSQRFLDAVKPELDEKKVETADSKDETLILRFKDGSLFQKGSSRIQPAGRASIERLAKAAKATPEATVRFDVHTDAVRAEHQGERKDTWGLTQEQGLELVRAMQKLGVDPSRIAYVSFGQFRPIASNETEEGRAKNRRVEVVVRRDFR